MCQQVNSENPFLLTFAQRHAVKFNHHFGSLALRLLLFKLNDILLPDFRSFHAFLTLSFYSQLHRGSDPQTGVPAMTHRGSLYVIRVKSDERATSIPFRRMLSPSKRDRSQSFRERERDQKKTKSTSSTALLL